MSPRSPAAILPDIGLSRPGRILRDELEARGYRLARGKKPGWWEVWKISRGARVRFPAFPTLAAVQSFLEGVR